jgi:hypothetical protein
MAETGSFSGSGNEWVDEALKYEHQFSNEEQQAGKIRTVSATETGRNLKNYEDPIYPWYYSNKTIGILAILSLGFAIGISGYILNFIYNDDPLFDLDILKYILIAGLCVFSISLIWILVSITFREIKKKIYVGVPKVRTSSTTSSTVSSISDSDTSTTS